MTMLTVTAKGQVTFRKDVLRHLGMQPGDKLELTLLPGGRAELRASRPGGSIDDFIGLLSGRTDRVLSIEEMKEIAGAGWAGEK